MTDPEFPPISRQQFAVLAYLDETWPLVSPQVEVAVGSGFNNRQTAKKYLDQLAGLKLAEYHPKIRGFSITKMGKQLIQFIGQKNCEKFAHKLHADCAHEKTEPETI